MKTRNWFLAVALCGLAMTVSALPQGKGGGGGGGGGGTTPPADPAIVYLVTGKSSSLYVMNADGSRKTQIFAADAVLGSMKWSPDGSKICFMFQGRLADGIFRKGLALLDVSVVNGNAVGSNFRMLVPDISYPRPTWSPDGSSIHFTYAEVAGIYSVPAGGGAPTTIVADPSIDWAPIAASPDGTRIAYRSRDALGNLSLSVLTLADLSTVRVCPLWSDLRNLDWAQTSDRILMDGDGYAAGISAVDAVEGAVPQTLFGDAWFPAWSPDDSKVVYTAGTSNTIYIKNLATGAVFSTGAKGRQADWRRF